MGPPTSRLPGDFLYGGDPLGVFAPDEVLAGRYRIVRFLAKGGMGEVYEAEDLELRERVALKTISAHVARQDAIDRFKREIHLARKVTHPNVCRIFDLGQHTSAGGAAHSSVFFLTMELLAGETLAARIRRQGRLSTDAALPIVAQLAQALDAAHRAGIVHRDFKSENIFLVEAPSGLRVVVTDFGVARGAQSDQFAALVTSTEVVGTPAYMAPEQVEGGPISAATDIYALGVVLYEMVTARLPFESDHPLTSAVKRLREPPKPPHVHVPDLDARWEKTILRCLALKPGDRFATAGDAAQTLVSKPASSPPPASKAAPFSAPAAAKPLLKSSERRLKALSVALLVVVTLAAGLVLWNQRHPNRSQRVNLRRAVAILGFSNLTQRAEVAWISTALAEMLGTELARGATLRTIPGETVARLKQELALPSGALSPETLQAIRTRLGCDFVVHGSYLSVAGANGERIRLDLQLQDAALGNTVAALNQEGLDAELFQLVADLGKELRRELGATEKAEADAAESGLPTSPKAARLYAEALEQLRQSQPLAARNLLQEAVQLEPASPMLHHSLSLAWAALGYTQRGADEAKQAFESSSRLSREDRLMIEGRYHEAQRNWPAAIEAYRTLWSEFPDDLEYGLRLVEVQIAGREPDLALATADQLRQLPGPQAEDPRIALAEASAAGLATRFEQQLEAGSRAATLAAAQGAKFLVARAQLTQSQAHRFLGQAKEAEATAGQALALYQELEHPVGAALAATALGNARFDQGDFPAAKEHFQQAMTLYQQIGDQGGVASVLNNLALTHKRQGDLESALAVFAQAAAIYRETGDELGRTNVLNNLAVILVAKDQLQAARENFAAALSTWEQKQDRLGIAYALNNLAAVLHLQGDLTASQVMHRRALGIREEVGHKNGIAVSETNLGMVLTDLGEFVEAEKHLLRGRDLAVETQDRSAQAQALHALGELAVARADFSAARTFYEQALALRRDLGEQLQSLDSELALAQLALEEGQAPAAELAAQLALRHALRDQQASAEAHARAILALAALAQSRADEAQREAQAAMEHSVKSERLVIRLRVALTAGRVRAQTNEAKAALLSLQEVEAQAERAGLARLRLEARLAQAEAQRSAGNRAAADELVKSVGQEAGQLGLGLIVAKAKQLSASAG